MKFLQNTTHISLSIAAAALAFVLGNNVQAINYLWGGGDLDWFDTSPSGWNGGPPAGGDNATINNGIVTLTSNNLLNPLNSITIGGSGKLTQTTDNTWNNLGNLTLNGGTLESTRTAETAFGSYQISNTATVTGSSASTISTNGSGSIFINLGLAVNANPTFTTFNVNDVTSSPAVDLTVSTILANNIAMDFSSFSDAGLIKTGSGTMTLSANNIYTAGTTVNGGILEIAESSIGNGYIRGTVTVNSGAELRYTGGDGTGYGFNVGNKLDTLNINDGLVNSHDQMTHLFGATVNMTGGELRVNNGLSSPIGFRIEWNASTVNTFASANSATISGRINLRNDGGYTTAVFNVQEGAAATDLLVSAAMTQSDPVGITKNGAGTMELSGVNSYTGNTTVNDGALLVSGGGSLNFRPTNNGATNSVTGSATAMLSFLGTVNLDLSAADATLGNSWNLFNLASFSGPAPTLAPASVTSSLGPFTEVTSGTWELPVIGAKWVFTEIDGSLAYINATSDYDSWKSANGVIGGTNDDDDGDGLTNHEEYAFGLIPTDTASVNPIAIELDKITGTFSYTRRKQSITNLTYSVWYSTDLANWTEDTGAIQGTASLLSEVETVPVTLSGTLLSNPNLFIQIRVN